MKTGLVMEGGAMRGMFTCGVIDVLLENGVRFDGAAGISAGISSPARLAGPFAITNNTARIPVTAASVP